MRRSDSWLDGLRRQLENGAQVGCPAYERCAVEGVVRAQDQGRIRVVPVCSTSECMENCFRAAGRDLEDGTGIGGTTL